MQIISLETKVIRYDSLLELPEKEQRLLEKAKEATAQSYAPYSNFHVGAAAYLEQGDIALGANQENAAYPMCLCAEMVLLSTISSEYPKQKIKTIAISVKNDNKEKVEEPIAPCGACRQTLLEFEHRQGSAIRVLLLGQNGVVYEVSSVQDLLPFSFSAKFM